MKFDTGVPIGRGAMGEVVKCWDPRLNRYVAVKLLRSDEPDAATRMLQEARAQTRVDHPNVCKVYEVGELDGRPFIAMQLIDGPPLNEVAPSLSLEQKVRLVRQVAEAVHAAHEAGLIHRDLKPANILVESDSNDTLTPYVVDFGIAREHDAKGITITGQVVGTPGYVSPEQARGESSLDGRSDVFSLGVTLYELLSGTHPFPGESAVEVLMQVLNEDPQPLGKIRPSLPSDLVTITMACLEKDPARRYASARELALDLDRYLAGEPIDAKPASTLYWLRKKARKHALAVAMAGAAIAAVLIFGTVALRSRQSAVEQAMLAARFGEMVDRLETRMRLARALPRHDITEERAAVERDIARLEEQVAAGGTAAAGPGRYALGRAYLSVGRYREARERLDASWRSGYRTARVARALGEVSGELYFERLVSADRIADPELRALERDNAWRELGEPTEEFLRYARDEAQALESFEVSYVQGLLALYAGDLAAATTIAREAAEGPDWFYEPRLLEGRAELRQARASELAGDVETADEHLNSAEQALTDALARAPSDAEIYLSLCRRWTTAMDVADSRGEPPDDAYEQAARRCDEALEVDPMLVAALDHTAEMSRKLAIAAARRGEAPEALLERSMAAANRSLELAPENTNALFELGSAYRLEAERRYDLGREPFESYERGKDAFERALELAPGDARLLVTLGHLLTEMGIRQSFGSVDPLRSWREAEEIYERGITHAGRVEGLFQHGLCAVRSEMGYYLFLRGRDPGDLFEGAISSCKQRLTLNPDHLRTLNSLGIAWWSRAEYESATGEDSEDSFREGIRVFEHVLSLDPDRTATNVNLAHLLEEYADWRARQSLEVEALLERAERYNHSIETVYPGDFSLIQAKIELVRAEVSKRNGRSPAKALTAAELQALRAVELFGQPMHLELLADVHRRRAVWMSQQDPIPAENLRGEIDKGLEVVERSLGLDINHPESWAHKTALERLGALVATSSTESDNLDSKASASLARTRELRPDLAAGLDQLFAEWGGRR